jgi:hypothetical protein
MPRKATGKVMVDKIWVEQKNGTWYCYERRRVWEDGQTKTIGKRLIGKSDERGGELRPTRPKRPPKPEGEGVGEAPEVTASREHTGMCDILEFIGSDSGIDEDLLAVTDEATAKKLISVSRFLVGTDGATLPSIEEWQNTHPSRTSTPSPRTSTPSSSRTSAPTSP